MRIAVIGAGAMGSIYGGRLSLHNEVYMVDTSAAVVDHISRDVYKRQVRGHRRGETHQPELIPDGADSKCEPADQVLRRL